MKINKDLIISDTNYTLEQVSTNQKNIEELKPVILFNGDTTGTVTLSSSAANFAYIEIFYKDNASGYHSSIKLFAPNGKTACLWSVYYVVQTQRFWFDVKGVYISGTSITSSDTGIGWLDNADGNRTGNENRITITRVIGYK